MAAGFSQEIKISPKKLPSAILKNYKMEYPNAHITGATREITNGDTVYEVLSKDSTVKRTVSFHSDGIPIEIEETMPVDQLPAPVTNAIANQYPNAKILVAEMVMRGADMTYEVLLKDKKRNIEVKYNMDGSMLPAK